MRSISVQVWAPKSCISHCIFNPVFEARGYFSRTADAVLITVLHFYAGGVKSWLSLTAAVLSPTAGQLMGMNEITEKLTLDAKCRNEHSIVQRVTTAVNVSRVPCGSDKECR